MAETKQPPTFLSYSRENAEFALKLAQDLRSAQANVWIDQLDIMPGMRWDQAIEKAMEDCVRFMVVLSPDAVDSDNVMDELTYALEEGKSVIPVLYRLCKIPFRLRRIQYVDFTGDYGASLNTLIEVFNAASQSVKSSAQETKRLGPRNIQGSLTAPVKSAMPNKESKLWDRMVEIIAEQIGVAPNEITHQAKFMDDLGADSLDLVELIMVFEEEYNIEIPDEVAEKLLPVGEAYQYGLKRLKSGQ